MNKVNLFIVGGISQQCVLTMVGQAPVTDEQVAQFQVTLVVIRSILKLRLVMSILSPLSGGWGDPSSRSFEQRLGGSRSKGY